MYDGGRKCVKGFCGGLEDTILTNHQKYLETKSLKLPKVN